MRRFRFVAALVASLSLLGVTEGRAASLVPVGTFDRPIFVTSDPDDPERLFVVERDGVVQLVASGKVTEFADLTGLVSCCTSERGLLSIALAPDFASSGLLYASYTGTTAAGGDLGDIHVDAFVAGAAGVDLSTRMPIISIGHSANANHNGGQLQFGPDGYLYISVGDGGGGGDPFDAGQNLTTLLGKVLRIDPRPGESPAHAIPPGNPFAGPGEAGLDEIWAYGLRNPWRFSFDRQSGDMVLADVGQGAREEIDFTPSPAPGAVGGAGANYGWDCHEGLLPYAGPPDAPSPSCTGASGFTDPVFDYPHTDPGDGRAHGCSVTGGYMVRDPGLGDLFGRYVYGDFCVGQIRSIDLSHPDPPETDRAEPGIAVPTFSLWSFGEDSCGRVYLATGGGGVFRLQGDEPTNCPSPPPPSPDPEPGPDLGAVPLEARSPADARRQRSWLGLRAPRKRVKAGRVAPLIARVARCKGRVGDLVQLRRGGEKLGTKRLRTNCTARFHPRIRHRSTFRARLPGTPSHRPSRSRRLAIGIR